MAQFSTQHISNSLIMIYSYRMLGYYRSIISFTFMFLTILQCDSQGPEYVRGYRVLQIDYNQEDTVYYLLNEQSGTQYTSTALKKAPLFIVKADSSGSCHYIFDYNFGEKYSVLVADTTDSLLDMKASPIFFKDSLFVLHGNTWKYQAEDTLVYFARVPSYDSTIVHCSFFIGGVEEVATIDTIINEYAFKINYNEIPVVADSVKFFLLFQSSEHKFKYAFEHVRGILSID